MHERCCSVCLFVTYTCSPQSCWGPCWVGQTRHRVFVKRRQMEKEERRGRECVTVNTHAHTHINGQTLNGEIGWQIEYELIKTQLLFHTVPNLKRNLCFIWPRSLEHTGSVLNHQAGQKWSKNWTELHQSGSPSCFHGEFYAASIFIVKRALRSSLD